MDDKGDGILEGVVEGKEKTYKQRPKWSGEIAKGISSGEWRCRGKRAFQTEGSKYKGPELGKVWQVQNSNTKLVCLEESYAGNRA